MSIIGRLDINDYIGNSLYTINTNFTLLDYNLATLVDGASSLNVTHNNLDTTSDSIVKLKRHINTKYLQTLCQGRLSLDNTHFIDNKDTVSNKIYFHPYDGEEVSLYNELRNTWVNYSVSSVLEFDITPDNRIQENTVVDIYLCYTDKLELRYDTWLPDIGDHNENTTRILFDNVVVRKNDRQQRFIGCLRYDKSKQAHIKNNQQILWNKYNKLNTIVYDVSSVDVILGEQGLVSCDYQLNNSVSTVSADLIVESIKFITQTQLINDTYVTTRVLSAVPLVIDTFDSTSTKCNNIQIPLYAGVHSLKIKPHQQTNHQSVLTNLVVTVQN